MSEYVITTDSNSDIPREYKEKHGITIIPQYYGFGDTVYGDEKNLSPAEFYQMMAEGELPTSMANNPAVIREKFEVLLKEEKDILHIAFSSALSGSYNNVVMVAEELQEEYPKRQIIVIDSLTVSLGETLLLLGALEKQAEGASIQEVADWLTAQKSNIHIQFTVDDVNHLYRGGRISKTASVVLGIVNIKPLLKITEEGTLAALGTIRGRKRSLSTLVNNMKSEIKEKGKSKRVGIIHANCQEDADYVAALAKEVLPEAEIIINDISPSIGTHAGPGALGICYFIER
ncbi:DegV family protein with EDD domain [Lachnospiraceae bacterium PF1-21]